MVDLWQHLLLVVDVLLLLQSDHVGDLHLLQGEEGPALLVLDQEDSAKSPCAWGGGRDIERGWGLTTVTGIHSTQRNYTMRNNCLSNTLRVLIVFGQLHWCSNLSFIIDACKNIQPSVSANILWTQSKVFKWIHLRSDLIYSCGSFSFSVHLQIQFQRYSLQKYISLQDDVFKSVTNSPKPNTGLSNG